MSDFKIKPKHWYQWLSPWWWRYRKTIQAVLDYQWEKYGKKEFEEKYRNMVLYGSSIPPEWYKTDDEQPPSRGDQEGSKG